MIGKLKKGSSFGGCIRYVTGKDEAKIIASDGVLLGTNAEMAQSFELQRQLNPRIKKPVGHIALSFKPEDKPRLTDEFMAKIALEYMQMMGITDTQFIIVRHHNTDNPHCHIVYNRINNGIPARITWIVAGANGIDVQLLHDLDILNHAKG